jgi:hypothetical protein
MNNNNSVKTTNGNTSAKTPANAQNMAPPSVAPRLQVQPYHEALKSALTKENWMTYTEALNKFLRGMLLPPLRCSKKSGDLALMGTPCRSIERCRIVRRDRTVHQGTHDSIA